MSYSLQRKEFLGWLVNPTMATGLRLLLSEKGGGSQIPVYLIIPLVIISNAYAWATSSATVT